MQETIPFALKLATRLAELFLVAAQLHFGVMFYRVLRARNVRLAGFIAAGAGAVGLFLVLISEAVTLHLEIYELFRRIPSYGHLASAVHVAGSFGAYCAYWLWRLARRASWTPVTLPSGPGLMSRRELFDGAARTAMAAPFLVGGYGAFVVRDDFEVRETELAVEGLPGDLEGIRIAQVSDIHYGPYLGRTELARIVAMTNELNPHLTVLTGDFITRVGDPLSECFDLLAGLRADSGVWGCLGNHEEFAECSELAQEIARSKGIRILRQEAAVIPFGAARVNLAGVDYQKTSGEYLPGAGKWIESDALNILLSHNPDVFPTAAALGYDLTLAGHTHGGQVTVEIVEQTLNPGRFFTPFVVGKYRIGRKLAYVTRGVGTVNIPLRIGATPEVTSLVLRSA